MTILAFDVRTVPDTAAGRRLYDLGDLDDEQVARAMFAVQAQRHGREVLPPALQRIVAVSLVLHRAERLQVWSLGELDAEEGDLVQRFFDGIEKFFPTLVSWNGAAFALPVLHYRALLHGVGAARYWQSEGDGTGLRYAPCHDPLACRHLDLRRLLTGEVGCESGPEGGQESLAQAATLLGMPAPAATRDRDWETFSSGDIESLRDAGETGALTTFLIYLRFERLRGRLGPLEYAAERDRVRALLENDGRDHLSAFATAWRD